jgi:hypothetical protein
MREVEADSEYQSMDYESSCRPKFAHARWTKRSQSHIPTRHLIHNAQEDEGMSVDYRLQSGWGKASTLEQNWLDLPLNEVPIRIGTSLLLSRELAAVGAILDGPEPANDDSGTQVQVEPTAARVCWILPGVQRKGAKRQSRNELGSYGSYQEPVIS